MKNLLNFSLFFLFLIGLFSCRGAGSPSENSTGSPAEKGIIYTVNGSIEPGDLNVALTHEHIMSNFGKDISETSEYNETELLYQVVPYLKKLDSLGIHSIFECTTAYFGRRTDLLQRIADSTGLQIITNTGFYGAANDRYVPEFAYSANEDDIAKIWIAEFENGIDGTQVRPGFIKLGFDNDTPTEIDKKLFAAGLLTHLSTGLALAVHTSNNPEAAELQMQLLGEYNVSPDAWIWVHANNIEKDELLLDFASKGAWISLDGVKPTNIDEYINRLNTFKSKNLLHKVLLSHDGNGFPGGGEIRQFDAISTLLIPAMLENGFSQDDINQVMIENPKEAFTIRVRRKS